MTPELDKIVDKLRKLQAHAESAEKIGSQAEAEAFAARFQELLLKHKLSLSDIEVETEEANEPVDRFTVDYAKYASQAEPIPTGRRVIWMQDLASIVAKAHFCRILVHRGSTRITLVGRKSDALVAEFMLVTLVRTAVRLVRKEYTVAKRERPHDDLRGFNVSFLEAFIARLRERFEEGRRTASVSTSTALVRINRAESAVITYMERFTKNASPLNHSAMYNQEGRRRGRERADSINLKSNAVSSGPTASMKRLA
jgi:hypothetical protein